MGRGGWGGVDGMEGGVDGEWWRAIKKCTHIDCSFHIICGANLILKIAIQEKRSAANFAGQAIGLMLKDRSPTQVTGKPSSKCFFCDFLDLQIRHLKARPLEGVAGSGHLCLEPCSQDGQDHIHMEALVQAHVNHGASLDGEVSKLAPIPPSEL